MNRSYKISEGRANVIQTHKEKLTSEEKTALSKALTKYQDNKYQPNARLEFIRAIRALKDANTNIRQIFNEGKGNLGYNVAKFVKGGGCGEDNRYVAERFEKITQALTKNANNSQLAFFAANMASIGEKRNPIHSKEARDMILKKDKVEFGNFIKGNYTIKNPLTGESDNGIPVNLFFGWMYKETFSVVEEILPKLIIDQKAEEALTTGLSNTDKINQDIIKYACLALKSHKCNDIKLAKIIVKRFLSYSEINSQALDDDKVDSNYISQDPWKNALNEFLKANGLNLNQIELEERQTKTIELINSANLNDGYSDIKDRLGKLEKALGTLLITDQDLEVPIIKGLADAELMALQTTLESLAQNLPNITFLRNLNCNEIDLNQRNFTLQQKLKDCKENVLNHKYWIKPTDTQKTSKLKQLLIALENFKNSLL